jgi:cysteine desulfurase/selenocysteine lyase
LARKGIKTIDVAIGPDGSLPTQAIIAALRPTTRAVSVATVSFSPGFRADLPKLGRACRERGILFHVDAAQSVGVLHTDVERDLVDALAVSTQKGLTALYGLGFLYVRRQWAERLVPTYLARFGLDLGGVHEADYSAEAAGNFAPAARRFEVGNPNFPAIVAADVALADILAVGTPVIEEHVLGLAGLLIEGIRDAGLPVVNATAVGRSHIVTIGSTAGFDADALHDWLRERKVHVSVRRGTVRFSLHGYNDRTDIARVVRLCAEWRRANDIAPRPST